MEPPLAPHPLGDTTKPWIHLRFIDSAGKSHSFYSYINEMSGNRLTAFDADAPSIDDSVAWIKTVIRDILLKSTNAEMIGTIKPATKKK